LSGLPRISLVTPSMNQAAFLEQTLRSVLEQQYPQLEVIVIDGGSSDASVDVIRRYESRLSYWISEPDGGQAAAINKGFAHSTGEILGWLNSDDMLFPGILHMVGEIFSRYPEIAWITSWGAHLDYTGKVTRVTPSPGTVRSLIQRGWYHGRMLGFIRQESTFWRRDLWQRAGGFVDETKTYGMDFDLWKRFAAYADLVTVQMPLGGFRVHAHQKTAQLDRYYREIGVTLPQQARLITLPARLIFTLFSTPFVSRLTHDKGRNEWQFHRGIDFQPGIR